MIVYRTPRGSKGINFPGAETPAFQLAPSCFTLRINEYLLVSISGDYIFSKRAGFPYAEGGTLYQQADGRMLLMADMVPGTGVVRPPLFRLDEFAKPRTAFFQPIAPQGVIVSGEEPPVSLRAPMVGPIFYESPLGTTVLDNDHDVLIEESPQTDTMSL